MADPKQDKQELKIPGFLVSQPLWDHFEYVLVHQMKPGQSYVTYTAMAK